MFSVVLCLILCYKRNGSWFGVLRRLWMHLGSWENTKKSRVSLSRLSPRPTLTLFSCSPDIPRASITRWSTPNHEPFLKHHMPNTHIILYLLQRPELPKSVCSKILVKIFEGFVATQGPRCFLMFITKTCFFCVVNRITMA